MSFSSIAIILLDDLLCFLAVVIVLYFLTQGAMGWSVIVPFPGHTQLLFGRVSLGDVTYQISRL